MSRSNSRLVEMIRDQNKGFDRLTHRIKAPEVYLKEGRIYSPTKEAAEDLTATSTDPEPHRVADELGPGVGSIEDIQWGGPSYAEDAVYEQVRKGIVQEAVRVTNTTGAVPPIVPETAADMSLMQVLSLVESQLGDRAARGVPLSLHERRAFERIVTAYRANIGPEGQPQQQHSARSHEEKSHHQRGSGAAEHKYVQPAANSAPGIDNNLLDPYHLQLVKDLWGKLLLHERESQTIPNPVSTSLMTNMEHIIPTLFKRYFMTRDLKKHGTMLINMVANSIDQVHDQARMMNTFVKVGVRHCTIGVTSDQLEHLWVAVEALVKEFMHVVAWPEEAIAALREVFTKCIGFMRVGASSTEGVHQLGLWRQRRARETAALMERIFANDTRHVRGFQEEFHHKLATSNNELFDPEQLEPLSRFHAMRKVLQFWKELVANVDDPKAMEHMVLELGARHVGYNISAEQFRAAKPYMIDTCRAFLGEEDWTSYNIDLIEELMTFVIEKQVEGLTWMADSAKNKRAPTSKPFALMFTDIEGSTRLAEAMPDLMPQAVERHNQIVRRAIELYGGYEVKTIGDSFFIACQTVSQAVMIASAVQMDLLLEAPIVPGFQMFEETQASGNGWREDSLRVRVGIDWCERAEAKYDPIHKHYDYHGPDVNRCARVESVAAGGQILLSGDAFARLRVEKPFTTPQHINFKELRAYEESDGLTTLESNLDMMQFQSDVQLKGIDTPTTLFNVAPKCLPHRIFPEIDTFAFSSMSPSGSPSFLSTPKNRNKGFTGSISPNAISTPVDVAPQGGFGDRQK